MRNCPEKVFLLILAVWTICADQVIAQHFPSGLPEIQNYTSKDYNWHPKNFQIAQGSNHLIYIGNSYGILEFDGKMWRKILLPNGLDGHTFGIDSSGEIYVGSFNEFGKIIHENNGQSRYKSLSNKSDLRSTLTGEVIGIWEYQNRIILATNKEIIEYSEDSFTALYRTDSEYTFLQVERDKLYFQTNSELITYDLNEGKIKNQIPWKSKIIHITPNYIIDQNGTFIDIPSGKTIPNNSIPKGFAVQKVIELESGHFALGSSNHGLLILNEKLSLLYHINSQRGLLSDNIFDLFEDKEHNLWLALDNGISRITLNTPFTYYGISNGLRGMGYTSAVHNESLFLGTSQGLFTHNEEEQFALIKGLEGQIYELKSIDFNLYIAHEEGLFIWNNGIIRNVLSPQKVWTIQEIPHNKKYLLLGTESGLFVFNKNDHKSRKLEGFDESSRILVFDSNDELWMCHGNKGLYKLGLDYNHLELSNVKFYSQSNGKLPAYISFISSSKKGMLFSGEDGVYRFNFENESFEPNQEINTFLKHNYYIDKIIEGTFQSLWIIQDNKITKLDPLDNGSYTLLPENIITELSQNLVGSYEHLHVYDSNNVIIGTQDGFAHFNVNTNIKYKLNSNENKKQTILREAKFEKLDSVIYATLKPSAPLVLPYEFNSVTFTYAPGYFQSREEVKFSFYLENKDLNQFPIWSDWHESNQNSFKNLSPGSYIFHVRSRGDLNTVSERVAYAFEIKSPWYASRLSAIIYTLVLIAIGILIYRIRITRLKKEKNEALKKKDDELAQQKLLSETEKIRLINDRLKEKVQLKNKELGSVALEITRKNEFLSQLKKNLSQISSAISQDTSNKLKRTIRSIDQNMRSDNNWERFEMYFDESHQDFIKKLKDKHPDLTKSSINLSAFLKLDLSTKEIASLMNISVSGVEKRRYRLRKKLDLDTDINLKNYLDNL